MIADILKHAQQEGRAYWSKHPAHTLADAHAEAWRRWPEKANSVFRALFLTGWTLAASEVFRGDSPGSVTESARRIDSGL
jgi:hypothetical protein